MSRNEDNALFRANALLRMERALDRVSPKTSDSSFIGVAARHLGEGLRADVFLQADLDGGGPEIPSIDETPLTPLGRELSDSTDRHRHFQDAAHSLAKGHKIPAGVPRNIMAVLAATPDHKHSVIGAVRHGHDFSKPELWWALSVGERLSSRLLHRERTRGQILRDQISRKIFEELRPKDVLYQILHGLKKLFRYDHSGAVLLFGADGETWTLQAEIISWTKAKSDRVGEQGRIEPEVYRALAGQRKAIVLRPGRIADGLRVQNVGDGGGTGPRDEERDGSGRPESAGNEGDGREGRTDALSEDRSGEDVRLDMFISKPLLEPASGSPDARACLLGVLRRRHQLLGVVQLLSREGSGFTRENVRTFEKFLPLASTTVYNSELYEQQHTRMVSAERKVGLGELARAISHDLNNAFGVLIPLLENTARELEDGQFDPKQIQRDVEVALHYSSYSARIFRGLLSMGRGRNEEFAWKHPNSLLKATVGMVAPNLESRGISIEWDLGDTPTICVRQGEIEQTLLNLIYNARDAMRSGGVIRFTTRAEDGGVTIRITDSGTGISEELRSKIFEPFFTTKQEGTGLGLDICRSIVWEYGGNIDLLPESDGGTSARVWLPRFTERVPASMLGDSEAAPGGKVEADADGPDRQVEADATADGRQIDPGAVAPRPQIDPDDVAPRPQVDTDDVVSRQQIDPDRSESTGKEPANS